MIDNLLSQLFNQSLSRRDFAKVLTAFGVTAAGVTTMLRAAEAVESGVAPIKARSFTGTGGQLIVEQMKDAGVKYLFTNPGSYEVGFFDAFLDQPMQLIMGMHEGIVISMADGYSKVSGEPAFVNIHVAAGTAQAAGQLFNSHCDGTPLVITAGMRENESVTDNVMLAARPGWNLKDINRQFTKISWETRDAKALPTQIRRAFKVATTAPGGPVYLGFSETAQEQKDVTGKIYSKENFIIPNDIPPNPDQIERTVKAILDAKSPVLWLGDAVAKDKGTAEAMELAELLNIPVCDADRALVSFPRRHRLYRGYYSAQGNDLVLAFGCELGPYPWNMAPGTPMIRCSPIPDEIGRMRPFNIAMIANTKLALQALVDAIKSTASEERIRRMADSRKGSEPDAGNKMAKVPRSKLGLKPIDRMELGLAMEEELDKDCILVEENLQSWKNCYSLGPGEKEKGWVSTKGIALGWGLGAAIGTKLAEPNRQVVLTIGDGSIMYSACGYWSAARYEVPILAIVSNNHNYETVRNAYYRYDGRMKAANRYTGMMLDNPDIDFVGLARSQGWEGAKVENSADLRPAIRRGIAATRSGTPFLLDVDIARQADSGGTSTWHQEFSVAGSRTRKV